MGLANSYFLLYHGEQLENLECTPLKPIEKNDEFFQISALILCSSRHSFRKYGTLGSFEQIVSQVSLFIPSNIYELNRLQFSLIEKVESNLTNENLAILGDTFCYLNKQKILNKENYKKLMSLFDFNKLEKKEKVQKQVTDDDLFIEVKKEYEDIIKELSSIVDDDTAIDILDESASYLNDQKFSIGITGVMNSGKSSMLNTLLGKEVLGTSVVPETANLSVLNYSKDPYAKVYYWNKAQWEDINRSAQSVDSIKAFVEEVNKNFHGNVDKYIKEENRCDTIALDELSEYTSAKSKNKISNLVKYVELGVDLKFLDESIEIVDTPGLDDPVIQREEITKEYISKCDLMLHLMNVSQSATEKDMDFIIDALIYQNITKLLIVLTKADTISKDELHEVVNYVKKSIRSKLAEVANSKLDDILQNLMIIPISSKMAMLHKTGNGEEARALGYELEDTGITEIEHYLYDTLFGPQNQKGKLIISSVSGKVLKAIEKQKEAFKYTLTHFFKSTDELESELKEFTKEKIQSEQDYLLMENDIKAYKKSANEYVDMLETYLTSEFDYLNGEMLERVVNDVKYTVKTTKNKPEDERIKTIIFTAVKDGVIDIIRDYRFKFIKKSETIHAQCKQKYSEFGLELENETNRFDAVAYFGDEFMHGFLTASNDLLVNKILDEIHNTKTNKLDDLENKVRDIIAVETVPIYQKVKDKANSLSKDLLEDFFKLLNDPLKQTKQELDTKEKTLNKMIENSKLSSSKKEENSIMIHEKLEQLEQIEKRCAL